MLPWRGTAVPHDQDDAEHRTKTMWNSLCTQDTLSSGNAIVSKAAMRTTPKRQIGNITWSHSISTTAHVQTQRAATQSSNEQQQQLSGSFLMLRLLLPSCL